MNATTIPSEFVTKTIDGVKVRVRNPEYNSSIESHRQKAREDFATEMAELDAAQKADAANQKNRRSLVQSWLDLIHSNQEDEVDTIEIPLTAVELHREKYPPVLVKNQPAYGDFEGTGWMDARSK